MKMNLKPCPFCGESLVPDNDIAEGSYSHPRRRGSRKCWLSAFSVRPGTQDQWNRREQPQEISARKDSGVFLK